MSNQPLHLFEAFGIELEYMVVDRDTLRPRPIAESILIDENGQTVNDISLGAIDVSNELATHVLEFKTARPTADLDQLECDFADAIQEINLRLAAQNAMLAPTGAHPFMDPKSEGKVWSKGDRSIYETYHRIFDCHRHGWLNLQSCHLNLPFGNEEEFSRLHAAVILVLPYLPALAASSPFIGGQHKGFLDTRLDVYQGNQAKVPQIAGSIIPEAVFTYADYQSEILQKTYDAIAPHDPKGMLQYEWLNSRGAIARFDRNAIEIRVLDTQENPSHDIAICSLVIALLEKLCQLDAAKLHALARAHSPETRKAQFLAVARDGFEAELTLGDLSSVLGLKPSETSVGELWHAALLSVGDHPRLAKRLDTLHFILREGCLAERMLARFGRSPSQAQLADCLAELSNCLDAYKTFEATSALA